MSVGAAAKGFVSLMMMIIIIITTN